MKESHPIEVAEFAKVSGIDHEPAFVWWVAYTLRKRDVIIATVKHRICRTTHKYGIIISIDLNHAKRLDKENGNDYWMQALKTEMKDVGMVFKILDDGEHVPVGYTEASGHLVWDIKMDFARKARWVLDGHKTESPNISTYAGVVSRESVRIALTYAALNDVDIYAADIRNAYLQAPSSQKHYVICGVEFGLENMGKKALIIQALYGGKSAGRDFRNHLRECMSHLGFKSCLADPDVWMRAATKSDGSSYWEYVLLYVDDALCISENAERVLRDEVGKYFELKEKSIGPPKMYWEVTCARLPWRMVRKLGLLDHLNMSKQRLRMLRIILHPLTRLYLMVVAVKRHYHRIIDPSSIFRRNWMVSTLPITNL